ncbi:phosphopantetheine-binding protein [Paenibacillus sp. P25]|nr:phosphopantetheine-binding protein [Paenibacillus sp. P25]
MAKALQAKGLREEDLLPISYTLLKGRHHFSQRCAIVVKDLEDAVHQLQRIAAGEKPSGLFEGKVPRDFKGQKTIQEYADGLLAKCREDQAERDKYRETLGALADFYCQGYELEWDLLFGQSKPRKVRSPGYPFAREHYWVKPSEETYEMPEPLRMEEARWYVPDEVQPVELPEVSRNMELGALTAAAVEHLKKLLKEVAGIPGGRLEDDASFEELGLDSLMIASLNKKVEIWVGGLDATLFYKYNNVKALAAYLAEAYKDAVAAQAGLQVPASAERLPAGKTASVSARPAQSAIRPAARAVPDARARTDIAIIGVAGRYPKAETLDQFWRNLLEGKDCIEEIPPGRWKLEGFFEPNRTEAVKKGLSYSKWGGFLDRIEYFDPLFFNISPLEAMYMDPQERLFLEIAWSCMEDAGYTRESLQRDGYGNQIGVFAGATFNNYQLFMAEAAIRAGKPAYMAPSQTFSIANRVSYIMNFTGPSLTVDTACSSSLYAVHLACESIRNGQSRMAIAGGVNLSLHPSKYITLSQGQFSASDGRRRAFSEGGTGYVPAEAVGAVFLKPLQEAVKDNDFIYGVIKGTAVSHAGRTNGYTVPSPVSQSLAIETALQQSGIHPRTVSCIEAHGTGTSLGDPIEIKGLTDVFGKYTEETGYCSISSVKSNIGHAEAAAGIAQLTKVLLQLKHRTLVKNVMHGDRA